MADEDLCPKLCLDPGACNVDFVALVVLDVALQPTHLQGRIAAGGKDEGGGGCGWMEGAQGQPTQYENSELDSTRKQY